MWQIKVGMMVWILVWLLLVVVAAPNFAASHMVTKEGCNETCKNSKVLIPYPFGIGKYYSHNSSYEIVCKPSNNNNNNNSSVASTGRLFKPFLYKYNIEVLNILLLNLMNIIIITLSLKWKAICWL